MNYFKILPKASQGPLTSLDSMSPIANGAQTLSRRAKQFEERRATDITEHWGRCVVLLVSF